MPFGPRLDRPSAVGDEGRPRATSLQVGALVVVGLIVATGVAIGRPTYFLGLAFLVGLTVAGVALMGRDAFGPTVVGHLLFLPGSVALGFVLALRADSTPVPVAVLTVGATLALAGVSGAWADVSEDDLETTLAGSVVAYVLALVGLTLLAMAAAALWFVREVTSGVSAGNSPLVALVWFLVVVAAVAGAVLAALVALPVAQLAPVGSRESVERRTRWVSRGLLATVIGSVGFVVLAVVVALAGPLGGLLRAPPVAALLGVLRSVFVTGPLLAVGVLALLVAMLAYVLRRFTREYEGETERNTTATVAAAGYVVVFLLFELSTLFVAPFTAAVGALAAVLLPFVVYLVLGAVYLGTRVGVVHGRTGPIAVASVGLVVLTAGAGLADLPSVVVFASVAGALAVWDVGTYGLGVTAELGHLPGTRRLELYHGVFAVGVGCLAVAGATAVDAVRQSVAGGFGAPEAMALAAVGVVFLLLPLRG